MKRWSIGLLCTNVVVLKGGLRRDISVLYKYVVVGKPYPS